MKYFFCLILTIFTGILFAQQDSTKNPKTDKISHTEPLYMDLVRDLGARKGEQELNIGYGMQDYRRYIAHTGFVEYEFAPARRLGMEIEVPFTIYQPLADTEAGASFPGHRIDGIKLAMQYTFLVAPKAGISMAAGYIHEFEMNPFREMKGPSGIFKGQLYNPFFVVAKRWGKNIHTLLYTGPVIEHHFLTGQVNVEYQVNMNLHYVFPGAGHFIGLEVNQEFSQHDFRMVFHPQIKLKLGAGLALGCVAAIPSDLSIEGCGFFTRFIFEPRTKLKK